MIGLLSLFSCARFSGILLCLAAAWSLDSHGGCFSSAEPPRMLRVCSNNNCPHELEKICVRRTVRKRTHKEFFHNGGVMPSSGHSPLLSCGWVYQELCLSKRTLYFTKEELIWECQDEYGCECSNRGYLGGRFEYAKKMIWHNSLSDNEQNWILIV